MNIPERRLRWPPFAVIAMLVSAPAFAHAIGGADAAFVAGIHGPALGPFFYLGAKHMVTGYDHLLFLAGIIFFLRRLRDVLLYVSLFSLGHSLTLIAGTLIGFGFNALAVDAVIGLSVAWKAFDNIGGFEAAAGWRPDPRLVVFGFGLVHGLGLATRLEVLRLNREGLLANLLSFNVGVEIGQLIALSLLLGLIALMRRLRAWERLAMASNWIIMAAGFTLTGYQLAGWQLLEGA